MNNINVTMIKKAILYVLVLSFFAGISAFGLIVYFSNDLPKIETLSDYRPPVPTQIFSKDGTLLAEIGLEKREIVNLDAVPKMVLSAFLAAEDGNFFEHKGVDYLGVIRALFANIRAGRVVQGGSTITQQVAKSLLLSHERSLSRKVKDFLLAQQIEKSFSKEEILFLYLNQVYLGGGYYGIKEAFRGYYGKELQDVTPAEAAMVAGLLVAPGRYSPYINPEYAKKRQHYVLDRMLQTKVINDQEYKASLDEKIKFRSRKSSEFKAGYFTDWIRQRVIEKVGEESLLKDGYKIVTTLDWEMQKIAESEVQKGAEKIDKRQGYKGPIEHIDVAEENNVYNYIEQFRKKIYLEKSQFFTIGDNYKKVYEVDYSESEIEALKVNDKKWQAGPGAKKLVRGYDEKDHLIEVLDKEGRYKALVTHVDDVAQIIYVSIGGVSGIIPNEYFKWAHERDITEEVKYFPFVKKPSTIAAVGDIVLVKVINKSTALLSNASTEYQNLAKKQAFANDLKNEKYVLCMLDQDPDVQAALLSVTPAGKIVALVGGTDFQKSQFNRVVQSLRQPGSSYKPILYAAALERGYTPSSIIIDSPEALAGVDESLNWKPRNYDGKFMGPVTFRNALEHSRNVPTIKIADKIGVQNVIEFSKRIGFNANISPDLSLSLGTFGATLSELVKTYAIFPNGGKKIELQSIVSITDRYNKVYDVSKFETVMTEKPKDQKKQKKNANQAEHEMDPALLNENTFLESLTETQVYDPRLAYIMSNLLKGVIHYGTGEEARSISPFIGGKTGTTNNYVDAWFIGFSNGIVTGVWTGFDDNKTLGWSETGAKAALPIWKEFMKVGIDKYGEGDFRAPLGIINIKIDKNTGELAHSGAKDAFVEAFVEGTEPGSQREQKEVQDEKNVLLEEDDYYNNQ